MIISKFALFRTV